MHNGSHYPKRRRRRKRRCFGRLRSMESVGWRVNKCRDRFPPFFLSFTDVLGDSPNYSSFRKGHTQRHTRKKKINKPRHNIKCVLAFRPCLCVKKNIYDKMPFGKSWRLPSYLPSPSSWLRCRMVALP
jgi:hypothetical protein